MLLLCLLLTLMRTHNTVDYGALRNIDCTHYCRARAHTDTYVSLGLNRDAPEFVNARVKFRKKRGQFSKIIAGRSPVAIAALLRHSIYNTMNYITHRT